MAGGAEVGMGWWAVRLIRGPFPWRLTNRMFDRRPIDTINAQRGFLQGGRITGWMYVGIE
jgi:hypothetical protein